MKILLCAVAAASLAACNDPSNDGIRTVPQSEPHVTYIYVKALAQPCGAFAAGPGCAAAG